MRHKRGLVIITASLMLLLGAVPAMAFNYTDGWDMVSAPPPPGPYRAVNLDPRIPGQDVVPMMSADEPPAATANVHSATALPAGALEHPPAAGAPAMQTAPPGPAASMGHAAPQFPGPPRGYNMMPATPSFGYPVPPRGYPGYRNMPPMGYYGAPVRRSPRQVPPPPVYDAMMKHRQPYYNQNSQGTP